MIVPLNPLEFRDRAVRLFGSKVGIVDGDKRFTYAEYDVRINRLANALQGLGVSPGEVVSFITRNSHQLLEAYYAVPQIKCVLNPINIRLSRAEIEYMLNHAGTRILCFQADFLPLVNSMRARLPGIRNYVVIEPDTVPEWAEEYEEWLKAASPQADVDLDAIDENAVVELFYTSGTTGSSKGVTITNRSLYIHTLMAIPVFNVTDEDTLLHVVPLFHVNGWGTPHFLTAVGGKHVILRDVDYGDMLRLVEAEQVTRILGVPTIFNGLVNHPDVDKYDLSSLKECLIGGAPSPPSLIDALEEKIGCRAIVGYGLTETTPLLTMARPKSHLQLDETERRAIQVKTGLPVVGVRLRVVDRDGLDVAADGKSMGEIIVRGNTVMDGYLNDVEATENVIVNGWFHTGDVAVMDEEGYITIVDRMKDIIISGGENISSVEVEKVILGHPAVFETVVIGVPDERWGEVPHALVVLKDGEQITEDELKAFIRAYLAGFKVPKKIEFREDLPKGGTGKIQKRELREPYWTAFDKRIH
ncbi:MAG: fatty acid--CoA ligase [Candidatus Promineifilaceae bacterium]